MTDTLLANTCMPVKTTRFINTDTVQNHSQSTTGFCLTCNIFTDTFTFCLLFCLSFDDLDKLEIFIANCEYGSACHGMAWHGIECINECLK